MKRFAAIFLSVLLLAGAAVLPAGAEEAAPVDLGDAKSVLLMEKCSGQVLYEYNSHEQREPASVTKIMTLLLAMEAIDGGEIALTDVVTVSAHAASMGGSQVYLEEGEQITVEELLKCVAVSSGNDAAVALGEYVSGSETAFVADMNERAAQLGMEDTNFVNCTGLPAEGHLTSANDIALMSRELILNHPDIRTYTTIWMDSIRQGAFGLSNTNKLLRSLDGCTGLKTGFTASAGYCMSATAERDGMELIAVVMGASTSAGRNEVAAGLINYGFAAYSLVKVVPEAALPPVSVTLGCQDTVQPVMAEETYLLVPREQAGEVTVATTLTDAVTAPVEQGQVLGQLTVSVGGQEERTVSLIAAQGVERLSTGALFLRLLRLTCLG